MRRLWLLIVLLIVFCVKFYCGDGGIQIPSRTQFLIDDRIRNTPVVVPEGNPWKMYVTTFGLKRFDKDNSLHTDHYPIPIPGALVRFNIFNPEVPLPLPWQFMDVDSLRFDDPIFTENNSSVNCYNDQDRQNFGQDPLYNEPIEYVDVTAPKYRMILDSGTGCWASPVYYSANGQDHLIVLNKSGCLMSLNVSSDEITLDWKLDLRSYERAIDANSFKQEFIATPTLVGNYLYIAGIKIIFKVSLNNPSSVVTYACLVAANDRYESPVIYDTKSSDTSYYAVSKLGQIVRIYNGIASTVAQTGGTTSSQPILDPDGHIYFPFTDALGQINIGYFNQEVRIPETAPSNLQPDNPGYQFNSFIYSEAWQTPRSTPISDFANNLFFLDRNGVMRVKETYDIENMDENPEDNDPMAYDIDNTLYATFRTADDMLRFESNHSYLASNLSQRRSVIFTINNQHSDYFSDREDYYYPLESDQINLNGNDIVLHYYGINNNYNLYDPCIAADSYIDQNMSFGGVAPYVSLGTYYNVLFGDETGCITSYDWYFSGESANFDPLIFEGDSVIPEMGMPKFMQSQTNVPDIISTDQVDVYIDGVDDDEAYVFANSNFCTSVEVVSGETPVLHATFANLLPSQRYTISWQYMVNGDTLFGESTWNEISPLNDVLEIFPYGDYSVPENVTAILDSVLLDSLFVYGTVILQENSKINTIYLYEGSELRFDSSARLTVGSVYCMPTAISNNPHPITINLGYGSNTYFRINNQLQVGNYNRLIFINGSKSSYSFNDMVVSIYASASIVGPGSDEASAFNIDNITNNGTLYIADTVKVRYLKNENAQAGQGLIIGEADSLHTQFGHLIIDGSRSSESSHRIIIRGATNGRTPKLSLRHTTQLLVKDLNSLCEVYGILELRDSSILRVHSSATLAMMQYSRLELRGDLSNNCNGAQLSIERVGDAPAGKMIIEHHVMISGQKPDPNADSDIQCGDRIITDRYGTINGIDIENPRKLKLIVVSTAHPSGDRWEGLSIRSFYQIPDDYFELENSAISGIGKLSVDYPISPKYNLCSFINCSIGVLLESQEDMDVEITVTVQNCYFASNECGILVKEVILSNGNNPLGNHHLKLDVSDECIFGGENADEQNQYGICLIGCKEAKVSGSEFLNNMFGIFAQDSFLLVGGEWLITDDNISSVIEHQPNRFRFNDHAAIWLEHTSGKSLVLGNFFTEAYDANGRYSGIGIFAKDAEVDIIDNSIVELRGHAFVGDLYSVATGVPELGFKRNYISDNGGCEIIGDATSLSNIRLPDYLAGYNQIRDIDGPLPTEPQSLFDYSSWDAYLLGNLTPEKVAHVYGNVFRPNNYTAPERFYPDVNVFNFGPETPPLQSDLDILLGEGISTFLAGGFEEAEGIMKIIVDSYPDSIKTGLAIDYLYLIERAGDKDFDALRDYLDLKIPQETMPPYYAKEEIKTQCLVRERDYPSAIERLQLIIENPISVADSLFALIDQSYCLFRLASSGSKNIPQCTATSTDLKRMLDFYVGLKGPVIGTQNADTPVISHITMSNYPNPFNPTTTICFESFDGNPAQLRVYNVRGQFVKELVNGPVSSGKNKIIWNGTDSAGNPVASGIYLLKLKQAGKTNLHKVLLLK